MGAQPLHEGFGGLLLDLDGVVRRGRAAVPGAREALTALQAADAHVAFVTNNALLGADEVAASLLALDLPVHADQVVTSPQALARLLESTGPRRVLVVGGRGLRSVLEAAGHQIVDSADDSPDIVAQGYSPDVGWPQLAEATLAIRAGAQWYATNPDPTLPTERGLVPGNGALVAAVRTATGREPIVAGKPETPIFRLAAARLGSERVLVIGDRLDTDVRGANAAGYASALVLTGAHGIVDLVAAPEADRPRFVLDSLRELLEPYPEVLLTDDAVTVRKARVRAQAGRLRVGGDRGIDGIRALAAAAAAWPDTDATEAIAALSP